MLTFAITLALFDLFNTLTINAVPVNSSNTYVKRWYSTPILSSNEDLGPWPVTIPDSENNGKGNIQPVRYCYKDAASYQKLQPFVDLAVMKWQVAVSASGPSAFSIGLDSLLGTKPYCSAYPSGKVVDALVLEYEGDDCDSHTTVGYDHVFLDKPFRNTLKFCTNPDEILAEHISSMTHELGHAIGLLHEHQRPDRDIFVNFACSHLLGYNEARAQVLDEGANDDRFTPDTNINQRMAQICGNYELADYYFPEVLDHMRGDQIGGEWTSYNYDADSFDYDSIMIYSSFQTSKNPGSVKNGWVLQRHTPGDSKSGLATDIWQGGSEDPDARGPSPKDAARVVEMYPLCVGGC